MRKELAEYLDLTEEEVDAMDLENNLREDTGSSGEMVFSYYFNVPECTLPETLKKKDWRVGELVLDIPKNIFG